MGELEEALYQATCFYEDAEKYGHDIEFPELSFSKGQRNYERILRRLRSLELPNPILFKYSTLTVDELKSYLTEILTKVLGEEYKGTIEDYNSLIKLKSIANPFDAVLNIDLKDDKPIVKQIHLSDKLASIEVVAAAHEYIHALLTKYTTYDYNRVLSNIHYKELLSILIEYVTVFELSQLLKEPQLADKHNIQRLYADKQHAEEHHSSTELAKKMSTLQPSLIHNQYKLYIAYENHSSFGYITSDIYATRLFELYQDDPKTLLTFIRSIIEGEKSIKELLKHYNLALNNSETITTFSKRMDNIPRI